MTAPLLWLADELWLITHEDHSGAARLHASALGLGLAGAVVGELVLSAHVEVQDGGLYVINQHPPGNALGYEVFEQVLAEPQHPVPTWLTYLARDAEQRVAQRMCRNGYLHQSRRRGLRRASDSFVPSDANTAAWPAARLQGALSRRQLLGQSDVVLAGLVAVAGLADAVLWRAEPDHLRHLVSRLPAGLRELLALTEAAVGDATLTHHRT